MGGPLLAVGLAAKTTDMKKNLNLLISAGVVVTALNTFAQPTFVMASPGDRQVALSWQVALPPRWLTVAPDPKISCHLSGKSRLYSMKTRRKHAWWSEFAGDDISQTQACIARQERERINGL